MLSSEFIYLRVMQEIRRSRHSFRHICHVAGVHENTIKNWGNGIYPSLPALMAVADAIGITPSELLMDDPYKV